MGGGLLEIRRVMAKGKLKRRQITVIGNPNLAAPKAAVVLFTSIPSLHWFLLLDATPVSVDVMVLFFHAKRFRAVRVHMDWKW